MRAPHPYILLVFCCVIHFSCAQKSEPYPYNGKEVVVQKGETALDIATRYGITLKRLVEDNFIVTYYYAEPGLKIDIHQDSLVHPGQVLRIYNTHYNPSNMDQALKQPMQVYSLEIWKCPSSETRNQLLGFENLVELYLTCKDSVLPVLGLTELTQLELLSISSLHNLIILPDELFKITQLKHLDLHFNGLYELPDEITMLEDLKYLNLGNNKFSAFPVSVAKIESLESFQFASNDIQNLPSQVGNMKSLKELKLSMNGLTSLPIELGQLDNLQVLDLQHNKLEEIPSEIGDLSSLRQMNLSNNDLSAIPASIGLLKNLESLNLWMNHIQTLPESIGSLSKLTHLNLGSNELVELPESLLKSLPRSCTVDVRGNNLSEQYIAELKRVYPQLEIISD